MPDFSVINDAVKLQTGHRNRVEHLLRRRSDGGMGLAEDAPSVVDERRKLERATAERNRLQELADVRSARSSNCKRLEVDVANWAMRGGVPVDRARRVRGRRAGRVDPQEGRAHHRCSRAPPSPAA